MDVLACYSDPSDPVFDISAVTQQHRTIESRTHQDLEQQFCFNNDSFDLILISESLTNLIRGSDQSPNPAYLINWLRLLKPNGSLYLVNQPYLTLDQLGIASMLIEFIRLEDGNCVITKRSFQSSLEFQLFLFKQAEIQETKGFLDHTLSFYFMSRGIEETLFFSMIEIFYFFLRHNKHHLIELMWENYYRKYPDAQGKIFYALSRLHLGQYHQGFKLREKVLSDTPQIIRSKTPPKTAYFKKRWQGEPLAGKTFVIWSEFGLGDEIMFAQLAHFFKRHLKVEKLIVVVQSPIFELMKSHPDIDVVVDANDANENLGNFDYWDWPHSLLSHIEQPQFSVLPKQYPYLFAQPQKQAYFTAKLKPSNKLKVGLAWRGAPTHENDELRSIHNMNWLDPLLELEHIDWYCIQKELNPAEREWLDKNQIPYFSEELADFTDTAALVSQMDLVISVDTSIAHLAGALNIPTFLMLPLIFDWRWGGYDPENLWYPRTRTFFPNTAMKNFGMLDNIQQVKQALQEYIAQQSATQPS